MQKKVEMLNVWQERTEIWENMESEIYLPDYASSGDYISDCIQEAAGDEADGVSLADVVNEYEDIMDDVIHEYGFTSLRDAAYWAMERVYADKFYNELLEGLEVYALVYIHHDLGEEEIPAKVWEKIVDEIENNKYRFDKFWEIEDIVDDAFREYQEEQGEAEDCIVAAM